MRQSGTCARYGPHSEYHHDQTDTRRDKCKSEGEAVFVDPAEISNASKGLRATYAGC